MMADAQRLSERLSSGQVERSRRAAVRSLLSRAFEAMGAPDEPGAANPRTERTLTLVRQLDSAAYPRLPFPGFSARIGNRWSSRAVDLVLLDRLFSLEGQAERLSDRIDRFARATGLTPLRLFVRTVEPGRPADVEMPLTEG